MNKKIKQITRILLALTVLVVIGYLYSVFIKPNYGGTNIIGVLLLGLALGGLIAFLIFKLYAADRKEKKIIESSHTVVESMRKVFKIVCAEGQFHEIYNYEETKKLFKIIPSTKKALVIVQAKVMIGYDFEKCVWEKDEENRKIRIVSFPEPEILSLEPEFKYYYFEEDLFNLISREDLHKIQDAGKKQVMEAALNSDLKKIAALQMKTMLTEVISANRWGLENVEKIDMLPSIISPRSKEEKK
ncbi:conserved hypothetical protein [uncultured Paludibacter sp.]|uniref:DUF4230 domain-containing protein n=1 Tax=uncultured Paludibacter sp. TaxID=497635 RepID=A0A653AH50_9BACT|nr:conserved hypothetical protein [uncultured Paludibacter sp.]